MALMIPEVGGQTPPTQTPQGGTLSTPPQSDPLQLPQTQADLLPPLAPQPQAAPRSLKTGGPLGMAGKAKKRAGSASSSELKQFLKRLGVGLGILSVVLFLLGGLGLIAEPIALTACFVGLGAAIGMIVGGKVWLLVIAFKESPAQGLLVFLVPYYWLFFLFTRKGRALHALALIVAALVPALICGAMLTVFLPRYQSGGSFSSSRRSGLSRSQLATVEERIRASRESSPDADVLRNVSFPTFSQIGRLDDAKAEQVLAELPGYVPGSFLYDARGRKLSFQYRGAKEIARQYGLVLASQAKVIMSFTPTFHDQPLQLTEAKSDAGAAATETSQPPATPPVTPGAGADPPVERTVSFQTLGQSPVNQAAADQALSQVNGYVAGSFRFDQQNQLVTLRFRGSDAAATQLGFALQRKLQMTVRLKPIFAAEE
jgi:hypothetical protein